MFVGLLNVTTYLTTNHTEQERRVFEMSTTDKLRHCRMFKQLGNMFHREGQYYRAAGQYRKCLVYYEYAFPDTEEEQAELDQLRLESLLNLCACKLKTKQYDEVVEFASQVSEIWLVGDIKLMGCSFRPLS